MRKQFVKVENFRKLAVAAESLAGYQSIERMGLAYGMTGLGKTTSVAFLINHTDGFYLRARRSWTPTAMLREICYELFIDPTYTSDSMVKLIVAELTQKQRTFFVDEADYLFCQENRKLLDLLRDIHDLSNNPIMLIGMEDIERKLSRYPQLSRRITHFVQFKPISLEDAKLINKINCQVRIDDDLLNSIYLDAKGNTGQLTVGIASVEKYAIEHGWEQINASMWGERPFFLRPRKRKHEGDF
ncbi:MAG TPA: DNA transposition protein [Cyanobacteria bacterium UBA11372]|nr:DNA transposition protein [Cyanobacteria bacterium UBA11372]